MVRATGLQIKSGWLLPSGSSSMNCVIMTPGTLDFFRMPTNDTECVDSNK